MPPALEEICLTALAREPEHRFASLQDFINAIEGVGGVAEVAPGDLRPVLALMALRERQGDMPGALGALERASARYPEEPRVALRYGLLLSSANQLERAAEVLGAWTRKHEDARALAELGYVRYRAGLPGG